MLPVYKLAHILDQQEDGIRFDWLQDKGFRSQQLETAVSSRSEEIAAVGDFLETRAGRKIQSSIIGAGASAFVSSPYRFVRFGAKGAVRMIPVVGWVLLAYDLYGLGEDLELY